MDDRVDARRTSDEEFDRLYSLASRAELDLDERPFVKNIENVQGDERDVIHVFVDESNVFICLSRIKPLRLEFNPRIYTAYGAAYFLTLGGWMALFTIASLPFINCLRMMRLLPWRAVP